MRTALISLFVVMTGAGGEIALTHAMKRVGEVRRFSPAAILRFVGRAMLQGWMWAGVGLLALSFYGFLTMLSWYPVSFVMPVTSLGYIAGPLGAKFLLRERLSVTRWAGIVLIFLRSRAGVGRPGAAHSERGGAARSGARRGVCSGCGAAGVLCVGGVGRSPLLRPPEARGAADCGFRAAGEHPQAGSRPGPRRVRKLRQFLPAGLPRVRNSIRRDRRKRSRGPGDSPVDARFSGSPDSPAGRRGTERERTTKSPSSAGWCGKRAIRCW